MSVVHWLAGVPVGPLGVSTWLPTDMVTPEIGAKIASLIGHLRGDRALVRVALRRLADRDRRARVGAEPAHRRPGGAAQRGRGQVQLVERR